MAAPFRLGINYWTRTQAMYWWRNFDAAQVRDDFALIRHYGMDTVRLFLLWDHFQPAPDRVDETCLGHLETVCDIAQENGLELDVTFFTGHMSGPNWAPGWLLDADAGYPSPACNQLVSGDVVVESGYRNMYTDETALAASRLLLKTVVQRLKDHPAIWLWNLGNEPDLFARPPDGAAWVREMKALINNIDSEHLVTCGLHNDSLLENNGFRVDKVYAETDIAVMHAYPMYSSLARQPLDPDFVPFTCALTSALCGKPTLMEEFGGCTTAPGAESAVWEWTAYGQHRTQFMASEDALAAYLDAVLPRLVDVGATGAFLWCFADYAESLWEKPPCKESKHERFFGLVRPDGSVKPHADVIKRFAERKPTVQPAKRTLTLAVTPDEYYADPAQYLPDLYAQFIAAGE